MIAPERLAEIRSHSMPIYQAELTELVTAYEALTAWAKAHARVNRSIERDEESDARRALATAVGNAMRAAALEASPVPMPTSNAGRIA